MNGKQTGSRTAQSQAQWERRLEQALPAALTDEQFFICLQPRFEMPTRRIIGAEALLRWNFPKEGVLFPSEFLPAVERAGLLMPLDLFALGEVCKCIVSWKAAGIPLVPININISRESLLSPHFMEQASGMLQDCNLPHGMIECELDAQTVWQHALEAQQAAARFRQMGCRVAVHGFKESLSVLSLVLPLGFDTVKVNCRFYAPEGEDEGIAVCVQAYNAVRQSGTYAVCEGVEFLDQLKKLEEAGCNVLQGYALSRPVDAHLFADMTRQSR